MTGDRPNISSYTVQDERKGTNVVDLNEYQFKIAFTVQRISEQGTFSSADDPNFVEWFA